MPHRAPASHSRRHFLSATGLFAAASLLGCRSQASPALIPRSWRSVSQVLPGVPATDGAGVRLTRIIGQPKLRQLDPFLLLDRFHSDRPGDYIKGFPNHPHRGFETVTLMLDGRMRHKDSVGNAGVIQGGGSQWMTAGRGIIHSEIPEQEQGLMSGYQLWVNLPAKAKMTAPYYEDLQPDRITEAKLSRAGSVLRLTAGEANGLQGPVRERPTAPTVLTLTLADDTPFELDTPEDHTAVVFVAAGEVDIGPENDARTVGKETLAILGSGRQLRVRARRQRADLVIAAARPLHEPIVRHGPFVMNTEAEIRQAYADYRSGRLAMP